MAEHFANVCATDLPCRTFNDGTVATEPIQWRNTNFSRNIFHWILLDQLLICFRRRQKSLHHSRNIGTIGQPTASYNWYHQRRIWRGNQCVAAQSLYMMSMLRSWKYFHNESLVSAWPLHNPRKTAIINALTASPGFLWVSVLLFSPFIRLLPETRMLHASAF